MKQKEEWRDIAGYEGYYQVSSPGRVRSVNRITPEGRHYTGQILKQGSDGRYRHVVLCKHGTSKLYSVARLVALAFVPNPKQLPCVNHKDEDKQNNRADNLEWCTSQYNSHYGYGARRIVRNRKAIVGTHIQTGEQLYFKSIKGVESIPGLSRPNVSPAWQDGSNQRAAIPGHL